MPATSVSVRRVAVLFGLAILGIAACAALAPFVVSSSEGWAHARRINEALRGAKSVTLVEYARDLLGPELVFQMVPATPAHLTALRAATDSWIAPIPGKVANCFSPHHRVEIVRADGSTLQFKVCFQCNNFQLGEKVRSMPFTWSGPLRQFFTDAGMAPLDDYSARLQAHPDYPLVKAAWAALEAAPVQEFKPAAPR